MAGGGHAWGKMTSNSLASTGGGGGDSVTTEPRTESAPYLFLQRQQCPMQIHGALQDTVDWRGGRLILAGLRIGGIRWCGRFRVVVPALEFLHERRLVEAILLDASGD